MSNPSPPPPAAPVPSPPDGSPAAPASPVPAQPAPVQPVPAQPLPAPPAETPDTEPEPVVENEPVPTPKEDVPPAQPKPKLPAQGRVSFPPAPYTQVLAVRSGPSTSNPIVARLPEGSIVTVVKVQGNWGQLKKGGWASLGYIVEL